jgi:hypothetical protein
MMFAAAAFLAAAQPGPLSVADVIVKSDALEKKGMLAIFSSDVGAIKAEANRDIQAFVATLQAANKAHRPLPACPPQDANGWKFTFNTDEVLKFYRSIPPQQRGISSVQGFAQFMKVKYPCR